jgi:hypothetical protein
MAAGEDDGGVEIPFEIDMAGAEALDDLRQKLGALNENIDRLTAAMSQNSTAANAQSATFNRLAKEQDATAAASARFLNSLKVQAQTLGLTGAALAAAKAEYFGVGDEAAGAIAKISAFEAAQAASKEAARAETLALRELSAQIKELEAAEASEAAAKARIIAAQEAARAEINAAAAQATYNDLLGVGGGSGNSAKASAAVFQDAFAAEEAEAARAAAAIQTEQKAQAAAAAEAEAATAARQKVIAEIEREAALVGKSRAEALAYKAAQAGVSEEVAGAIGKVEQYTAAMNKAHGATSTVTRETLVLGREALRGNWTRMAGSSTILASAIGVDLVPVLIAAAAAAATFGAAFELLHVNLARGIPDDLTKGMHLTQEQLERVKDRTVTFGDTVKATFEVIGRDIEKQMGGSLHKVHEILDQVAYFLGAQFEQAVSNIAAEFAMAFEVAKDVWQKFPDVMRDIAESVYNFVGQKLVDLENLAIDLINDLTRAANEAAGIKIPQLDHQPFEALHSSASGTLAAIGADAIKTGETVYKSVHGMMDGLANDIKNQSIKDAMERIRDEAGKARREKGAASPLQLDREELEQRLLARKAFGDDALAIEDDFWTKIANDQKRSQAERTAAATEAAKVELEQWKRGLQAQLDATKNAVDLQKEILKTQYDTSIGDANAQIAADKGDPEALQADYAARLKVQEDYINAVEALDEKAIVAKKAYDALMGDHNAEANDDAALAMAKQKALDQIAQAQAKAKKDEAAATREAVQAQINEYRRMFTEIGDGMRRAVEGLIEHTMTWRQAVVRIEESLLDSFLRVQERSLAKELATNAQKLASHHAMNAAKATSDQQYGLLSMLWSFLTGRTAVANDAVQAGAGAFKAAAETPIIGPFEAPAAGAAAFAAVSAMAAGLSQFSAAGGMWEVPSDGTRITAHAKEMVLPAWAAVPLRDMLMGQRPGSNSTTTNNRGGDTHHWHISQLPGESADDLAKRIIGLHDKSKLRREMFA